MKKFLILLFLSSFFISIRPEYIIFEKGKNGEFLPLGEEHFDKVKKIYEDVFCKYKWPECIGNREALKKIKDKGFLKSGNSLGEEKFLRKEVQKIDKTYDIAFVPTVTYELFCVWKYYSSFYPFEKDLKRVHSLKHDEFISIVYSIIKEVKENVFFPLSKKIGQKIENYNKLEDIKKEPEVEKEFDKINKKYSSHFCDINYKFVFFLSDGINLDGKKILQGKIKENIKFITEKILYLLIKTFKGHVASEIYYAGRLENRPYYFQTLNSKEFKKNENNLDENGIISKTIDIEYEARDKNKALLFRGAENTIQHVKGLEKKILTIAIADSPLKVKKGIDKIYLSVDKEKIFKPSSLAYGNSLFAGSIFDSGATVYFFFNLCEQGYSLFVDKEEYIENNCGNFFLISPLNCFVALFSGGEFFHSRTKVPIFTDKKEKYIKVFGIKDPMGSNSIIFIKRDPIKFAEDFLNYLIENFRFLKNKGQYLLEYYNKKMKRFHKKAAKIYNSMRSFYKKLLKKRKEELEKVYKIIHFIEEGKEQDLEKVQEKAIDFLRKNKWIDVNRNYSFHGETFLLLASRMGLEKLVKELLKHKNIDVNKQDEFGCTALIRASGAGYENIVEGLLKRDDIDVSKKGMMIWNEDYIMDDTALSVAKTKRIKKLIKNKIKDLEKRKK
ncbi:ankyrin repeat domain-containing protein [Candidatus Babeliales bacterium]|nr:ankyrin repeat domain-containing protein [Candidatus Babeliales bacterium]